MGWQWARRNEREHPRQINDDFVDQTRQRRPIVGVGCNRTRAVDAARPTDHDPKLHHRMWCPDQLNTT
jgi:hypothetical protein